MASDGVWDCVHPQPMCEYISKRIAAKDKLSSIIKDILGKIISKANNSKYSV